MNFKKVKIVNDYLKNGNSREYTLLKTAEEKGKIILPIIAKPCRFLSEENLSKFQSINEPKYPLSKINENDRNQYASNKKNKREHNETRKENNKDLFKKRTMQLIRKAQK